MKNQFNKAATQDKELIQAHCAAMYLCQTVVERGVSEDKFLDYMKDVYRDVLGKAEYSNVLKLREQLDKIVDEGMKP